MQRVIKTNFLNIEQDVSEWFERGWRVVQMTSFADKIILIVEVK